MKIESVDIGKIVKEKVKEEKMSEAKFAKSIGLQRQNVKQTVFNKHGLDTDLLVRISEVLGHNFFQYFKCDEVCNAPHYIIEPKDVTFDITFRVGDEVKEGSFSLGKIEIK